MPSGKSKSKENTWTEKDLTDAIQGERPRRSKDERKQRDDRPEKRHSRDRDEEDRERGKDRRRKKSERHQEGEDGEESHSRRNKDDRERRHKDRDKERMKDDENESGSKSKEKVRRHREDEMESSRNRRDRDERKRNKERNVEEETGDDRRRHRDKEERSNDKSRRHREDEMESSRDRRDRDERKRDKERNGENENDRRHREKEERGKDKSRRHREDEVESSRDKRDRDERKRDKERRKDDEEDHESVRQRSKDERRRERDEGNKDKERRERRRDKETDERYKDGKRGKNEHRNERHRDKSPDEDTRNDKRKERRHEDDDNDDERERRRRRKQERKEANENKDDDSDDKDRRRKDKKRSEENYEDKQRRREDKDGGKKKESIQDEDKNDKRHRERNDLAHKVEKKEWRELESNGRSPSISNAAEVVEEMQEDDDYGDYEDDFEDYEDDFEEEDDVDDDGNGEEQDKGKLLEIFEAINAENNDVKRSPFQQTINEDSRKENEKPAPKSLKSEPHGRINFFAAKQKHVTEVVASKTRRRAQELQNLIELDVASYDIFDLPPLNEYELYIKSYGQSDSKQAYVQCHDDIIEKEMQTEVIEMSTKWTQYPPDDFKGCGEGDENEERNELQENIFTPHSVDSVRLTHFLQQAGQVCLILLEEKVSARKDLMFKERNDIDISDGFIQLSNRLPFLEGRRVLDMKFNTVQTHLLLTAYDSNNIDSNVDKNLCLHGRGVVCYWNVNEPSQPQKILYCESSPRSCCFSPVKSSLVFAGLEDGSVVVWDIRESSSLHSAVQNKDNQWVIRRPTYSTAGVLFNENHLSPIQNILPIALPIDSAQALSRSTVLQDEPGGMAFQLASLDESGLVNIWVVIELDKPDEAGSESDLGLAPGGRVKLIRSTSIQIESPHREVFVGSTIQASIMQFSTLDSNHFYVGTDRGWVIHCTRYGGKTNPNVYRPDTESFVTISAIDVSPWSIPIMLVGCMDGTLRLHDLRKEHAVRRWPETTQGSAIVQVMWSKSRPSIFFVLDANSSLYIWDLLKKDEHPISYESFKRGKLLNFSMSNDYESLGIGLPGRKSEMVLNFEGGIIELHRLKDNLITAQADELDRFASFVDSII